MTFSDGIQLVIAIPVALGFLWVLVQAAAKLGKILKEVKPNSGNSLRDVNDQQVVMLRLYLERQEAHHKENREWMASHQKADQASFDLVMRRLDAFEKKLEHRR